MLEQPDLKKNIFILKHNNVEYEINLINGKIYEHQTNLYVLGFMIICIVSLIIFVLYDWLKDIMRWFSGVKDIYNNNNGGVLKILGWTKGNLTRTILIFVLAGLITLSGFFLKSTKELNYIPEVLNNEWDKFREKHEYWFGELSYYIN
jgi:hypothetical protein